MPDLIGHPDGFAAVGIPAFAVITNDRRAEVDRHSRLRPGIQSCAFIVMPVPDAILARHSYKVPSCFGNWP